MTIRRTLPFDPDAVRALWDQAADAYAQGQASGRDYYRDQFFGPAQITACGDVRGCRLLDIGCGSGWFARAMAERGARVTGVDLSPRMIEYARRHEAESPLGIGYHVLDAARIADSFPAGSFERATSCVALQDMPSPDVVLRAVHHALAPGGRLVASITHPFSDTPFRAWERDAAGTKRWLCVDRYFEREVLEFQWQGWPYDFTTAGLHVPLETWFDWILSAGFVVRGVREPQPTAEALSRHPDLEDAARVPYYVIFDLERGA